MEPNERSFLELNETEKRIWQRGYSKCLVDFSFAEPTAGDRQEALTEDEWYDRVTEAYCREGDEDVPSPREEFKAALSAARGDVKAKARELALHKAGCDGYEFMEQKVKALEDAAREVVETLTCPDCYGTGTLGTITGKPIACEKCGGHEDDAGLGYVLDGDNVVEKLNVLAAQLGVKE